MEAVVTVGVTVMSVNVLTVFFRQWCRSLRTSYTNISNKYTRSITVIYTNNLLRRKHLEISLPVIYNPQSLIATVHNFNNYLLQ